MGDVFGAQPIIESLKHAGIVDTVCMLPGDMMEASEGYGEHITCSEEIHPIMERSLDSG